MQRDAECWSFSDYMTTDCGGGEGRGRQGNQRRGEPWSNAGVKQGQHTSGVPMCCAWHYLLVWNHLTAEEKLSVSARIKELTGVAPDGFAPV